MVVIAQSSDDRELFISRLAVRLGFAKDPSDAKKIISKERVINKLKKKNNYWEKQVSP